MRLFLYPLVIGLALLAGVVPFFPAWGAEPVEAGGAPPVNQVGEFVKAGRPIPQHYQGTWVKKGHSCHSEPRFIVNDDDDIILYFQGHKYEFFISEIGKYIPSKSELTFSADDDVITINGETSVYLEKSKHVMLWFQSRGDFFMETISVDNVKNFKATYNVLKDNMISREYYKYYKCNK